MKQLSMQIYFKTPPPQQCHPNNTARASFLKSYTQKTLNSLNALRGRKKKKKHFRLGKRMLIWAKPAMGSPGQEVFGKGRLS